MPQPTTVVRTLRVDRIDFVDQGASLDKATGQGAHVLLYKRAAAAKKAPTFDEILLGRQAWEMNDAFYELTCTLSDTISAIIWDPETGDKAGAIRAALGSFETALEGQIADWLAAPATITKASPLAARDRARDTTRLTIQKAVARALRARKEGAMDPKPVAKEKPSMDGVPDAVKAYIDELEAKLAAKGKAAEPPKPEDVLKGLTPEARAVVEKAQADAAANAQRVAKLEQQLADDKAAQERARWIAKAGTLKALPEAKPDDLGPALAKLHAADPAATAIVVKALDSAQTILAANNVLLQELGHAQGGREGDGSAYAEMEKLAADRVAKKLNATTEQAIAAIAKESPELYGRYLAEQRARGPKR